MVDRVQRHRAAEGAAGQRAHHPRRQLYRPAGKLPLAPEPVTARPREPKSRRRAIPYTDRRA